MRFLYFFIILSSVKIFKNMDQSNTNDFLVVFDLDYTLWPFWVDTHISPPFRVKKVKDTGEKILEDGYSFEIKLYPEVFQILEKAKKDGIKMGTVSRTLEPEYGKQLLKLMDLEKYFISCEFDTGTKVKSIEKIAKMAGINAGMRKCLLFDDETRNIRDIEKAGGIGILLGNGLNNEKFKEGIEKIKAR